MKGGPVFLAHPVGPFSTENRRLGGGQYRIIVTMVAGSCDVMIVLLCSAVQPVLLHCAVKVRGQGNAVVDLAQ